ncbi:MAG: hypothetical protein IIB94_07065 [Candidatus Marinimicrobia bacterium]|nr:hypothetical protein [Candidatus Neomarinimicrobiota bacterium]
MLSLRDLIYQVVAAEDRRKPISYLLLWKDRRLPRHSFAVPRNDGDPLPLRGAPHRGEGCYEGHERLLWRTPLE